MLIHSMMIETDIPTFEKLELNFVPGRCSNDLPLEQILQFDCLNRLVLFLDQHIQILLEPVSHQLKTIPIPIFGLILT